MAGEKYLVLTQKFYKEGKRWLGRCEELGTSVFGRSLPETEKILDEAVALHLNTLEEIGERDHFFKENHIHCFDVEPENDIRVCVSPKQDVFIHPHIHRILVA